jgi:hypothetical protein
MYRHEIERLKRDEETYGKDKARANFIYRKLATFEHSRSEVEQVYGALAHAAPETMDNITIAQSYVERVLSSKSRTNYFEPPRYSELQPVLHELTRLEATRRGAGCYPSYEPAPEVRVHHVHEHDYDVSVTRYEAPYSREAAAGALLGALLGVGVKAVAAARERKRKQG